MVRSTIFKGRVGGTTPVVVRAYLTGKTREKMRIRSSLPRRRSFRREEGGKGVVHPVYG